MKKSKAKWLLIVTSLFFPALSIAEDADSSVPSIDLLEFLGEWTTEDQEWIDPMLMKELPPSTDTGKNFEENKDD